MNMSEEETRQIQPDPALQAEALPSQGTPGKTTEKRKRDSEKELLEILDDGGFRLDSPVRLAALQRACMAVPNLTPLLTDGRRAKLYMRLLLDDKSELHAIPESLESFSKDATEDYRAAATNLMALLAPISLEENEVVGFLCYLTTQMGYVPNDANNSLTNFVAVVLSDAKLSSGHMVLQLLFNLLRPLLKDFMTPLSSEPYNKTTVILLRLILQYHDPALSVHFDRCHISVADVLLHWVKQLFLLRGEYRAALGIIDYLLVLGDPVLIPYVALAYIIANRQRLLNLNTSEELQATLTMLGMELPGTKESALDPRLVDGRSFAPMPVWSGKSLLQNADLLHRNTPLSSRRVLELCLYPDMGTMSKNPEALETYYAGMPCLPLERSDIASSFAAKPKDHTAAVRGGATTQYIIVDCRSAPSFDYARLPTAVLVGDVVSFDADRLQEMVDRLTPTKGAHYSVFGTGRGIVDEANLLTVVVLHLVQLHFPFVSLTAGGFKSLIPLIRSELVQIHGTGSAAAGADPSLSSTVSTLWTDSMATPAVRSMLSGLSEIRHSLLPRAAAEAEEVRERAAKGFAAAGAWGAELMHKIQAKLTPEAMSGPPAANASGSVAKEGSDASVLLQGRVRQGSHVFTLGGDDESEDLDLILSIPTRVVRGKVITVQDGEAAGPVAATTTTTATTISPEVPTALPPSTSTLATPPPSEVTPAPGSEDEKKATAIDDPAAPNATLAPVVANIDEEFEQLFGEISTPVQDDSAKADTMLNQKVLDDVNDIFNDL